MKKVIDCLLIGHNEMDFARYEKYVRGMGTESGAYKDLNLNYIRFDNKPYSAVDIFNLFYRNAGMPDALKKPLSMGELFSNAIAYLGTYLHRRGFTFEYVNSFQDEKEELIRILEEENVLTAAVITTLYVSALPIIEITGLIKKHNPRVKIIIGGPFVSTQVRSQDPASLQHLFKEVIAADIYVNSSQGEAALVEIIRAVKHHLTLDKMNNIYYKTNRGYQSTPMVPEQNKLSENLVKWELFSGSLGKSVTVRASISCPFSCAFCGFPEHAGAFQAAAAEEIMQELKQLEQISPVERVIFIDDTFNVPQKRFKEILHLMIKNRLKLKWIANFRAQYANPDIVQLMKESGCQGVFLGIESGNDQILANMNKKAVVKKYLEGTALLKKYGIWTMGSFIVGFPGETDETVQDTLQFIKKSGLDFFRVQMWYCETITPIWRQREIYDLKGESFAWSHKTMDAETAARLVDEIFLNIEKPVWVPQYNFDFCTVWNLMDRGLSLEQVNFFLRAFALGIKQKLTDPSKKEIGIDVIKKLKKSLRRGNEPEEPVDKNKTGIDAEGVKFNF